MLVDLIEVDIIRKYDRVKMVLAAVNCSIVKS